MVKIDLNEKYSQNLIFRLENHFKKVKYLKKKTLIPVNAHFFKGQHQKGYKLSFL